MDNARPHTSNISRETMETLTNSTKFLSPYSFMLNPIEFSFSKVKTLVRSMLGENSDQNLYDLIISSQGMITREDAQGWFRLIRRNCALAMNNYTFY